MSVSFCWDAIRTGHKTFAHGTSSDMQTLERIAPDGTLSIDDLKMLRAMHMATCLKESLWNDIADALSHLRGDDHENKISIRIWTTF